MDTTIATIAIGLLIFLAHVFTAVFERTRIPDVLPLVVLGLLVGPVFEYVNPATFGSIGSAFTTIALVILLFESGLSLNIAELRASMLSSLKLTVISFLAHIVVVAIFCVTLLGLGVLEGALLGAIVGGTSSAVVIPMVKKLRIRPVTRTTLLLESTFSDVLCIVVALGLIESLKLGSLEPGKMFGQIIASFLMAGILGAAAGGFWSTILHRIRQLENSTFTTPAFVFIIYGAAELLGFSGAIAALAFGTVLGNADTIRQLPIKAFASFHPIVLSGTEKAFFAEIVFLLKTFFFVYIGLSIRFVDLWTVGAAAAITVALFAMRIPVVRVSLAPSSGRFDLKVAAILVPKGLAAAVLASLPLQAGLSSGMVIQDTTYMVILISILMTAVLSFLAEKGKLSVPWDWMFRPDAAPADAAAVADAPGSADEPAIEVASPVTGDVAVAAAPAAPASTPTDATPDEDERRVAVD